MAYDRQWFAVVSQETGVLVVTVIGAVLLGLSGLWMVEQELVARAGESLALGATEVAGKLDAMCREREGDLELLAAAPQVRGAAAAPIAEHLRAVQRAYPVYARLAVTDRAGRVVAATDQALVGQDVRDASWFQAVRHAHRVYGETIRENSQARGQGQLKGVVFSASIQGADGALYGAIMAEVDRDRWNRLVKDTVKQFETQTRNFGQVQYRVLSPEGVLLLNSDEGEQPPGNVLKSGLPSVMRVATGRSGYVEEEHLTRHVPVVTGYARMSGAPSLPSVQWGVLVRSDRDGIVAHIRGLLVRLGLAGLSGLIPMLGVTLWARRCQRREEQKTASALRALADSEARTRTVLHEAMDAVVIIDAQGTISGWNRQAEAMFGWEMVEVVGRSLGATIVPAQYRDAHARGVARFLSTGEATMLNKRIEISALRKDGTEFPVELTITPLKLECGIFFSAFVRDISERKHMISRLRESETFFRLLSEQLPVGVFEINEDGACLYKNRMWDVIMGRLNDEVFGFASVALPSGTWVEWVHPEDRPALTQNWAAAQANFSRFHAECRLASHDGPDRWAEFHLWPMADDRGIRYLGTLEDITTRREMTDRLRMSEAFFRLLSDHLPIGVFEIDHRGACLYGNRMWRDGFPLSGTAGSCRPGQSGSWLEWFHPDDREKVEKEWEQTRTTFDRVAVECRLAEGGEEAKWVNVLLWPMATEEGVRYLGTLEDITERKQTVARTMTLLRHGRFELQTLTEARHLAELLAYAFPDPSRTQLGLTELLVNGIEHGNLGISYAEKSALLDQGRFETELVRRLALPEHMKKRVHITVERTDRDLEMTILDAGSGFDWKRYLDLNRERADDLHGRGIAMAKHVSFDEVEFRGCGNQVVVSVSLKGIDADAGPEEERKVA